MKRAQQARTAARAYGEGNALSRINAAGRVRVVRQHLTTLQADAYNYRGSIMLCRRDEDGAYELMWEWGGDYNGFLDCAQHDEAQLESWMPGALEEAIEEAIACEPACAVDMKYFRDWARNARDTLEQAGADAGE